MKITRESDYPHIMEQEVKALWQQRSEGYLQGKENKKLFWVSLTSPHHNKALVVINGRSETVWKYQELFYHFFQQGYDIYSFDHRGQGLSERLTPNPHMGHVERFNYYVDDMESVINSVELNRYQQRYLLAHSMGGTIATRYLQTKTGYNFNGVVLSAPMFGVNISPLLRPIAPYLGLIVTALLPKPTYITGHRDYYPRPFEVNPLTSSKVRYHWFMDLYEKMPQLKLGGPTAQWSWQSLTATKLCIKEAQKITTPLLLLQSADDVVVLNQAQDQFMAKLQQTNPNAAMKVIKNSQHEVLFESDKQRNETLFEIQKFFEKV